MVLGDPRIARIHGSDANSEGRRDAPWNILMMTIFRSPYTPRTLIPIPTTNNIPICNRVCMCVCP